MRNKITLVVVLLAGLQLLGSCKKFLAVNPEERILESDYYANQAQAFSGLTSVYDMVGNQGGGYLTKTNIMNVASDDHWAGGANSSDIGDLQSIAKYTYTQSAQNGGPSYLWTKGFTGVYRANVFLKHITTVSMDATLKARYIAEAKLLRAYFYFDLVRFFKNIPLILEPTDPTNIYTITQVAPDVIYKQIIQDLKDAQSSLPATVPAASEGGRVTLGVDHALLARVYMWQKDYTNALTEFALVNGTAPGASASIYGYKLIPNFGDLWKTNNKFNSESIFEIVFNSTSNGGWGNVGGTEGNLECILVGPRNYNPLKTTAPDYVSGWSGQPFTDDFWNLVHYDPRNAATVANCDSLETNGIITYLHAYQNTGHFIEKFAGRNSTKAASGQLELNFPVDMYEIRLADMYLLEAEAQLASGGAVGAGSRAYALLNAVRARVGAGPVAVTLDNIKKERRLELAGEGQRWLDLVRWGDAGTNAVLLSKGFVANKMEIFPIPQSELNNTKIQQSKEWGGPL
ncbi:RagB/SusD family nutrient uptake outer membrane protein [Mucilaginibacter sp.]|uniref:RagB/SusD family nutrient uptake outer membrane protein n=1 Tax=Mucilaginibacter sp. TaxID=1882438 RepID=UPI00261FBF0D|nr:RagB/SusD family nutrient uptake outer membrane protein [Mucilaginibacter sp.]MDB5031846.1 RagB/SusD family nutrient uptake outer membrane protein [Mucilaginibacter sp.]